MQGRTLSGTEGADVGADTFVRPREQSERLRPGLPRVPLTSPFIFAVLLSTVKEFTETAVPLF